MELNIEMPSHERTQTSIEDILGPSENRYFGEGFKRAGYKFAVEYLNDKATGFFSVFYNASWSTKTSKKHPPHLSTVDAVLISGQVASSLLKQKFNLSGSLLRKSWIRKVGIKASNKSLEDLASVPVNAEVVASESSTHCIFGQLTNVRVVLGEMEIDITIDHSTGEDLSEDSFENQYFSTDYKNRSCQLSNVKFQDEESSITSELSLINSGGDDLGGLMGSFPASFMIIETITSFAQMAQALMYRLDNLNRDQTNNLWMRSVTVNCPYPIIPFRKHELSMINKRSNIVPMDGSKWRLSTVSGSIKGHPEFNISSKLCHSLPDGIQQ